MGVTGNLTKGIILHCTLSGVQSLSRGCKSNPRTPTKSVEWVKGGGRKEGRHRGEERRDRRRERGRTELGDWVA